jgi:aryl-alcohol dehydrogenase-like predicted oxidoreductase
MLTNMTTDTRLAAASGTFTLGATSADPLTVTRLGFGAMRITGAGIWDEPADRENAKAVLRRTVELGSTFIDTADSYGPETSEILIREALHPYADDVVVATKGGLTRQGPDKWAPVGRPEYLRQALELSLRRLAVERIDLWQLHRIDAKVDREEQFAEIASFVAEGKVRHVGLSEVSVEEIEAATAAGVEVVSVQNLYNVTNRASEAVLEHCEAKGIGFIPWFPLGAGPLAQPGGALETIATRVGCTPGQLALAWLLRRSPVILPIPGTGNLAHLEENVAAAAVTLDDETFAELSALAS